MTEAALASAFAGVSIGGLMSLFFFVNFTMIRLGDVERERRDGPGFREHALWVGLLHWAGIFIFGPAAAVVASILAWRHLS